MPGSLEWTFAYGSNMDVDDLQRWFTKREHHAARIERCAQATLPDYRLIWNYFSRSRNGGAANVERHRGHRLPGVALLVNQEALVAIDRKEGHPRSYSRGETKVPAHLVDGTAIDAWLYVAQPEHCQQTTVPPTRDYLEVVVRAAERFALPPAHIAELRATPTAGGANG